MNNQEVRAVFMEVGILLERNNNKRPNWKWFSVKLLFESMISGKPSIEAIDENYSDQIKSYEEIIILVRAQSFDQACKIAEKKAKNAEKNYQNPYDETVQCKLVTALDVFEIFDETIESGTELYSRIIRSSKNAKSEEIIRLYYPETVRNYEEGPDFNWVFRNKEFNKRPGTKG